MTSVEYLGPKFDKSHFRLAHVCLCYAEKIYGSEQLYRIEGARDRTSPKSR